MEKSNEPSVDRVEVQHTSEAGLEGSDAHDQLKRTKHGIVLEPQPSDDVHDPLNFSAWEKGCILLSLSYWAFLGTTYLIVVVSLEASIRLERMILTARAGSQSPSFFLLMEHYHISLDSAAYTVNGPLVAYGAGVSPM